MGTIRFRVPNDADLHWPELDQAFLGSAEGRVEPAERTRTSNALIFNRETEHSTRLFAACPVGGLGRMVVATAALRERVEPYNALVELARGRMGQIREIVARWRQAGFKVPPDIEREIELAQGHLCRATCQPEDSPSAMSAGKEALKASVYLAERLMEMFIGRLLAARRNKTAHLPILLSCPLKGLRPGGGWEHQFRAAFTAAKIAVEWSLVESNQGEYDWTLPDEQVDFADENRLLAMGGPLIDFRPGGLPAWLTDWSNDYWSFQSIVSDFVETAVQRYGGRIRWWEVAASPNVGYGDDLEEEFRLALTAKAIEVARQSDDQIQLALRIAQPWGEYQQAGRDRLSPKQFAEALVRSGAGLSSVTVEIAVGFEPNGSAYRDRFEIGRLIDSWSMLGVPLTIALAFPADHGVDENADTWIRVAAPQWKEAWSEAAQAEWIAEVVPLLMSKTSVVGIEWSHFCDGVSHRFPHAGLTRRDKSGKMSLERLTRFHNSYWRQTVPDD